MSATHQGMRKLALKIFTVSLLAAALATIIFSFFLPRLHESDALLGIVTDTAPRKASINSDISDLQFGRGLAPASSSVVVSLSLIEPADEQPPAEALEGPAPENPLGFVCANLDWWPEDKCDYGICPWHHVGLNSVDFSKLIPAGKALAPFILRIGGSLQDHIYYREDGEACPQEMKKDPDDRLGFIGGCFSHSRFLELSNYCKEAGCVLAFGLNALYGRRKVGHLSYEGVWDPADAERLLRWAKESDAPLYAVEMGNELWSETAITAHFDVEEAVKMIQQTRQLIDKIWHGVPEWSFAPVNGSEGGAPSLIGAGRPMLVGMDSTFDEKYTAQLFDELAQRDMRLDAYTHHNYVLGAGVDPEVKNKALDPSYMLRWELPLVRDVATVTAKRAPGTEVWMGEAGGAYNSGSRLVTMNYYSGFWYLDSLGMAAAQSYTHWCRQTLVGGLYGLLHNQTYAPMPDLYTSILWNKIMGSPAINPKFNLQSSPDRMVGRGPPRPNSRKPSLACDVMEGDVQCARHVPQEGKSSLLRRIEANRRGGLKTRRRPATGGGLWDALGVEGVKTPPLRIYAQCAKEHPGGVAILLLNFDKKKSYSISFKTRGARRLDYIFSSPDPDSTAMSLNGQRLEPTVDPATNETVMPALHPNVVHRDDPLMLDALSYSFIVLPDAAHKSCQMVIEEQEEEPVVVASSAERSEKRPQAPQPPQPPEGGEDGPGGPGGQASTDAKAADNAAPVQKDAATVEEAEAMSQEGAGKKDSSDDESNDTAAENNDANKEPAPPPPPAVIQQEDAASERREGRNGAADSQPAADQDALDEQQQQVEAANDTSLEQEQDDEQDGEQEVGIPEVEEETTDTDRDSRQHAARQQRETDSDEDADDDTGDGEVEPWQEVARQPDSSSSEDGGSSSGEREGRGNGSGRAGIEGGERLIE
ncbi:unnamed protein product [Vitrella brassicaformis CCMP3155]|uniref:Uncharacterized protein n=2 Tax=Vitrella brassicaformis TaxID=1169539 RepID=A0A0G4EDT2_VITBC|nr:unnamed protein product [Vitrella brassicaformis CCMP3155]|eukprot:CEL93533.1 unnamed protein product [Vitrella brassicaformis CCMP3155]